MTATVRGGDRTTADSYPTPPWCVRSLMSALKLPPGRWIEPAAGHGAIIRTVDRSDVQWTAIDIDAACESSLRGMLTDVRIGDFLTTQFDRHFDVLITNPPFSKAPAFVERALGVADTVVMLLRLAFVSTKGRFPLMSQSAPDLYVLPDRPQFAGTNRDSSDYAWFVWHAREQRRDGKFYVLDPVPAAERKQFTLT